ncbi:MAG: hypothetical protein A3G44_08770 [Candidatus Rokubacteria bacterium RIFCSPLOWO2_12_FULL_73_47]|nr:MAG: hypothetical protein A3G44_08770 [Candidatus Rokubacteria bacterium RIFCSPLOWO2_12_FULL_73_47]
MFAVEAEEHLQALGASLLALDRDPATPEAREAAETMFREAHTLKGAARSVGRTDVETLCQELESLLGRVGRGELAPSAALAGELRAAIDGLGRRLTAGGAPAPSAPVTAPAAPAPPGAVADAGRPAPAGGDFVRLATAKLDALVLQAEDLLVAKLAALERVREAEAVGALVERRADLGTLGVRTRELLARLRRDARAVTAGVDGLLAESQRLRTMPAAPILDGLALMVHDLARELGREVEWSATGGELELDRKILQAMKEPVIHLVRNAVDHGVEPPDVRARAGKPRRGRVTVTVRALEGNRIEIAVADDGRGIDLARVRAAAARARLLSAEQAETLSDDEALALVYRSGLSTSPVITAVSGHGLGLAIVRERVGQLGGTLRLETSADAGTTVRAVVPAAIATFRGLLVQAGDLPVLLPMDSVDAVLRIVPDEVRHVEGRAAVAWREEPLLLAPLAALLGRAPSGPAPGVKRPCVVVRAGTDRAAVLADEVLGEVEVLAKPLEPPLLRVRFVSGAGVLGTGRLALILRPADLVAAARRGVAAPPAPRPQERTPTVLVVDDSITTRAMEKNLLEAAGFEVRVAVDGADAWAQLRSAPVDLVVSDVDMPRMDGFELTTRIRGDRRLADLPVVLVTALESREDKERGIEVGANAYVVKSSFDQSNLLDIIRRLV